MARSRFMHLALPAGVGLVAVSTLFDSFLLRFPILLVGMILLEVFSGYVVGTLNALQEEALRKA